VHVNTNHRQVDKATRPRLGRVAAGPRLPTLGELNRATAVTAAAIADPASTAADIQRAAELEAATLHAYWQTPGAQAKYELEREHPELEAGI
jgi:hypothetical protein